MARRNTAVRADAARFFKCLHREHSPTCFRSTSTAPTVPAPMRNWFKARMEAADAATIKAQVADTLISLDRNTILYSRSSEWRLDVWGRQLSTELPYHRRNPAKTKHRTRHNILVSSADAYIRVESIAQTHEIQNSICAVCPAAVRDDSQAG